MTDITIFRQPVLADSGRVTYPISAGKMPISDFKHRFPIKTETGKKYQLAVTARDMVRNESKALPTLYVDKTSALFGTEFSDCRLAEDRTPFYKPYVVGNAAVRLDYTDNRYDSVFVKYYGSEIPLPRPSFSAEQGKGIFE